VFEHGDVRANREQARAVINVYGRHYNEGGPHSSLGYQTPSEFAAAWARSNGKKGEDREYAGG
jgi:putative transposase